MMIDQTAPDIEVCYGPECSDVGGRRLTEALAACGLKSRMGDCRNQCPNAPLVLVNKRMIDHATVEAVVTRVQSIQAGEV
ncbi:MAG: hypothetical protein AUK35_08245 [Zetaproteobacteria bacterium CG2_30_46_52]|nr:MAG: hypothetical protein AUK35_08245 [Zetaproteobacteria bacterium CG2_30_46_52]